MRIMLRVLLKLVEKDAHSKTRQELLLALTPIPKEQASDDAVKIVVRFLTSPTVSFLTATDFTLGDLIRLCRRVRFHHHDPDIR
jgi:hypothetical protein